MGPVNGRRLLGVSVAPLASAPRSSALGARPGHLDAGAASRVPTAPSTWSRVSLLCSSAPSSRAPLEECAASPWLPSRASAGSARLEGRPSSSSPRRRSPGAPWRSARVSDVRDGHQRSEPASQSANSRPAPPWLEHGVAGYPRGSQLLQVRGLHQGWHLGGRRGSRRRGSARESTRWREGCRTWRDSLLARPTAFCKARGRLASSRPSGRSSRCSDGGGPLVKAGTRRRTPTSAERGEARRRPRDAYARRARRRPR